MSDAWWRKKRLEMTKAEKMRAAKRAKSLGDEELRQNITTNKLCPKFQKVSQQNLDKATNKQLLKFLKSSQQAFLISLQLLKVRWKRNCGSDDEEEVAPGQEKDLEEDPDGDMEEEHECSDAQEVFDEWMLSLTQNHRKCSLSSCLRAFVLAKA